MRTIYNVRTGVTKIKSKTRQFSNKLTFAVAAGVASIGLAIIPMASAASTVVVTPSNPHGWYIQPSTGGTVDYVPATGALGNGAMQFVTVTNDQYARFKDDINQSLSSITKLSYMTRQVSAPAEAANTADVNLRLYIDTTGTGTTFNDVLVYEPYYNNVQQVIQPNVWQTWNIDQNTGFWWSNSGSTYNGHTTVGAGGYDTNFHLSDVLHDYPNAKVVSIGMGTGDFNAPWVVQSDALMVNNTTYNFETDSVTQKQPVTSKDQCMNNGWQNLTDANGNSFKNQGDCVSYVATKGKNTGAVKGSPAAKHATGNLMLSDPTQLLNFALTDNGASSADTGTVTYANFSVGLLYKVPTTCVNVVGSTAYFAYQIPSDAPVAANTWVVWKVVDNGTSDTAGFTTAADQAGANALCEAGNAAVQNYPITSGDVVVQ